MKKLNLIVVLVFIFVFSTVSFLGCNIRQDAVTYVHLAFNPSIELILNTANRVISVNAYNEEGQLLLAYEDVYGKDVKQVVKNIIQLSSKSGLLNVNTSNGLVSIGVANENAEYANMLYQTLKDICNTYFKTNGIFATASSGVLPQEIIDLANAYQIPAFHFNLMLALYEYRPDLTFDEIVQMEIKEIIKLLNEEYKTVPSMASSIEKQNYKEERFALLQTFKNNLKELFGEQYVSLLNELELLEAQIDIVSEEEQENLKLAIENKRQELKTLTDNLILENESEYNALLKEYKTNVQALKEQYKLNLQTQIANFKEQMRIRIENNKLLLQARIAYAKERKNNFRARYETFLALIESDFLNYLRSKQEEFSEMEQLSLYNFQKALIEANKYKNLFEE